MPSTDTLFSLIAPAAAGAVAWAGLSLGASPAGAIVVATLAGGLVAAGVSRARERRRDSAVDDLAKAIGRATPPATPSPCARFVTARCAHRRAPSKAASRRRPPSVAELTRDRARLAAVLSGMVEGVLVVSATGAVELDQRRGAADAAAAGLGRGPPLRRA